jgi:hypothetical protein
LFDVLIKDSYLRCFCSESLLRSDYSLLGGPSEVGIIALIPDHPVAFGGRALGQWKHPLRLGSTPFSFGAARFAIALL